MTFELVECKLNLTVSVTITLSNNVVLKSNELKHFVYDSKCENCELADDGTFNCQTRVSKNKT